MLRLSSFLTGLFFAVGSSMCFAQTVEFPISFINVSPAGNKGQMFTFAAHPLATAEVDTALGEREIPSIPPPAGVFIVYTIPPSTEYLWLSPKDIRQMKPGIRFREDYDVNILWTGGRLDITWDYPMPELIDSAYLVDAFTDFPNNFVKVKIGPGTSYSTDNSARTRFKVLVWYNGTTTSVEDDRQEQLSVYPNPSYDHIEVNGVREGSVIGVFDLNGALLSEMKAVADHLTLDTSGLVPGVYVLRVVAPDGSITFRTVVRQ
ncbi:MAG: T9SS type A sorting domain-containing protein [Ignavibacteria bacterium]|nr:T9SS type A sorting domain-containing protein [Ignavibacteria bacterium]